MDTEGSQERFSGLELGYLDREGCYHSPSLGMHLKEQVGGGARGRKE